MSLSDTLNKIANQKAIKARVGIIENKTYPDGEGVAEVAFWNEYGTELIPPRPFFRKAISDNRDKIPQMFGRLLQTHDPETAMRLVCEHMKDELQTNVMTWQDPPNAPSTVRNKGYNAPLRGPDRLLRNSFSYEINPDD